MTEDQESTEGRSAAGAEMPAHINCPACGYQLRGMPNPCSCPECGLPCDPHSVVVRLAPGRDILKQVFIGIVLILGVGTIGFSATGDRALAWFLLAFAALTVVYLVLFCRRVGQPSRLLLTPRGARFDDPRLDRGWIGWGEINGAKYSWLTQHFYLMDRRGKTMVRIGWRRLGSPTIARRCAKAINERLRHYGKSPTP